MADATYFEVGLSALTLCRKQSTAASLSRAEQCRADGPCNDCVDELRRAAHQYGHIAWDARVDPVPEPLRSNPHLTSWLQSHGLGPQVEEKR